VIRADLGRITIREGSNIQDNAVLHVGMNGCEVRPNATVGHLCVVHDCFVGEQALIGNGSTVLDGAKIGDRSVVAAGATVTPGMVIPPDTVAMGSPAKKHVPVEGHAKLLIEHNAEIYRELARRHAAGIPRCSPLPEAWSHVRGLRRAPQLPRASACDFLAAASLRTIKHARRLDNE